MRVRLRARNPNFRFRRKLLGWYVFPRDLNRSWASDTGFARLRVISVVGRVSHINPRESAGAVGLGKGMSCRNGRSAASRLNILRIN